MPWPLATARRALRTIADASRTLPHPAVVRRTWLMLRIPIFTQAFRADVKH
jgi:hypothetical protein